MCPILGYISHLCDIVDYVICYVVKGASVELTYLIFDCVYRGEAASFTF